MAKHQPDLDLCFAALADPTRRAILGALARGAANVTSLAAPHDMALPTLLAHIRKLEAAGLIETRREGRQRICTLAPDAFHPVTRWLAEQQSLWTVRLDQFDTYARRLAKERAP